MQKIKCSILPRSISSGLPQAHRICSACLSYLPGKYRTQPTSHNSQINKPRAASLCAIPAGKTLPTSAMESAIQANKPQETR